MTNEVYDKSVFSNLKYCPYVRKSTDDSSRQVRSIDDQVAECEELAKRLGLRVVKVIKETKSAKMPNKRPLFRDMIQKVKLGTYDAILAWNPDRLARNMLEAGEIIWMVDTGAIKDMKFVTHSFTPDANGKMLLGMAFVLSKQYSDDLSQKVTRGVKRSLAEGKTPTSKHGYIRNAEGRYVPDGRNHTLIKHAWKMRHEGESLEFIAEYLKKQGYTHKVKRSGKNIELDAKILSRLFRDPFYYGLLIQADEKIDLNQFGFQPTTTKEVYDDVQYMSASNRKAFNKRRHTFFPLKGMIKCSFCGANCVCAPSKSASGKRYLYYRCDNPDCTREKRSVRAKVVFTFIYEFFEKNLNLTENDYKEYVERSRNFTTQKVEATKILIHSKEAKYKKLTREIDSRALNMGKIAPDSKIYRINEAEIERLDQEAKDTEIEILQLKAEIEDPESALVSLDDFLNLCKNADRIVKSADGVVKDRICRLVFLNLTIDEEKVLNYQLKEPFATMLNRQNILPSRGKRN